MKNNIEEIRSIVLNIFIILVFFYIFLLIYCSLITLIPYQIYFIKINLQRLILLLGIILVLLYIPFLKILVYKLFIKTFHLLKSFSLGQKFVFTSIILLVYSAIALIKNCEDYANAIAILSYYLLALGVFNEFIDYILEKKPTIIYKINPIKTFTSLTILGVFIYYTKDIKQYFPNLHILIFIMAVLYILGKLIKNKKKSIKVYT